MLRICMMLINIIIFLKQILKSKSNNLSLLIKHNLTYSRLVPSSKILHKFLKSILLVLENF